MGKAVNLASGVLGGAATMAARSAVRRAMHGKDGGRRLPVHARDRHGLGVMLLWALAAGVILALADVLQEQRKESAPQT